MQRSLEEVFDAAAEEAEDDWDLDLTGGDDDDDAAEAAPEIPSTLRSIKEEMEEVPAASAGGHAKRSIEAVAPSGPGNPSKKAKGRQIVLVCDICIGSSKDPYALHGQAHRAA